MAQNYSQVLAELGQRLEPKLVSQINRANVLAQILSNEPAQDSVCRWEVRMGTETPTTAVIADGTDVSVFNTDTKKPAVLQFGTYHDAFSITDKQISAAMVANNPEALMDIFSHELMESVERLSRAVAYDAILGAGGADQIHGLLAAGAPAVGATGTYATINRATPGNEQFRGNSQAEVGTPALSASILRKMDTAIYNASGLRPDAWLCNPINHNQYGDSLGSNRRYIQDVQVDKGLVKLDGGYRVLEFDGAPVIMDKLVPAGSVIALSTSVVKWSQLPPPADRGLFSIGEQKTIMGSPERQMPGTSLPLTAYVKRLATGGNANKFAVYVYPQLKVKRPGACGVITGLLAS